MCIFSGSSASDLAEFEAYGKTGVSDQSIWLYFPIFFTFLSLMSSVNQLGRGEAGSKLPIKPGLIVKRVRTAA